MPDPRIDRYGQLTRGMGTIAANPYLSGATQDISEYQRSGKMDDPFKKWASSEEEEAMLSALIRTLLGEKALSGQPWAGSMTSLGRSAGGSKPPAPTPTPWVDPYAVDIEADRDRRKKFGG